MFRTISALGRGDAPIGAFCARAELYLFLASVPVGVMDSFSCAAGFGVEGGAPGYALLGTGTMATSLTG